MQISETNESLVAVLEGYVKADNAESISQELLVRIQPGKKLVLDLSGVKFLSSAGLRMLLQLKRASDKAQSPLILSGMKEDVKETMEITGFLQHFQCVPDLNTALTA
jgi:anti-sigma B factor antagonist